MAVMTITRPSLSWSHSRARMLERDCARRYYWAYYGSTGGWRNDANEETRQAYRLKHLVTLPMALGQSIDKRARDVVLAIRDRREPPILKDAIARTRAELNRIWQASRDIDAFNRAPKRHPMLLERYYGLPISNDQLLRLRSKVRRCLEHLYQWPGWAEVRGCASEDILLFEPTQPIVHAGVNLYAAPDLVYRGEDGKWEILDWKTGPADDAELQLATYAVYLREGGMVPEFNGTGRGRIVNLDKAEERTIEITGDHLELAERRIQASLWEMRRYLVGLDVERNEPQSRESFHLALDTNNCQWCPFFELCADELKNPNYPGPF